MRHARRRLQGLARLAAVGGVLCGGLMMTTAIASEPSARGADKGVTVQPAELGASLVSRLGTSRTAGSWIGSDGRPVVAVTDAEAAVEVGQAGARAKLVSHSMRRLRSATDALRAAPRVPGTAWVVDYASNEVVVHADSTVSAGDWSRMTGLADQIGSFVHMQRTTGSFTTRVSGGAPVFADGGRCSAGFNVTDGRNNFILTAGHCGSLGTAWFQDAQGSGRVGTTTASTFPGSDFSLVKYENGDASSGRSVVGIGGGREVRITAAADPFVGQQVFRSGSTTGVHSGRVTALNATVNFPEGTVTGLIETTVCAEPGDSGGPLFAQGLALGVTSGGNGDCTTGGLTYFQPTTTAMAALGVSVAGATTAAEEGSGAASPPAAAGTSVPGVVEGVTLPDGIVTLRTLMPGLLVVAVSLLGLMATRWIRSAHDRRSYRRQYSQVWG
ncbi:S1 family peptidase [Streptomyces spiramyceticus]|uniref:S1 family peptidase n=1 Tax=Streptomyces spiramyceticus TaxID=299717 RepID=UPI00237B8F3A|nr:S1 family peptidase [Streptomyces spiramyceticus]